MAPHSSDDSQQGGSGDEFQGKAGDFVRKLLTVGIGAVFLTEESIRSLVKESKLPKELLSSLLESAGKTKRDFLNTISNEVVRILSERVDVKALLEETLRENEIEFNIRMKVRRKGE